MVGQGKAVKVKMLFFGPLAERLGEREIEVALAKIANNEYGICEMCEDDIGFQRLKVKPHALYCIDCREIAEKSK
jgi:RNA polymerase-binding transcription factor DksA